MPWEPSHELRELNALYKELDQLYHKLASRMGLSDRDHYDQAALQIV